jgi:hypothetical protein
MRTFTVETFANEYDTPVSEITACSAPSAEAGLGPPSDTTVTAAFAVLSCAMMAVIASHEPHEHEKHF